MDAFRPKEQRTPSALWRPRPSDHQVYIRFGSDEDSFEVFVHYQVLIKVLRHMRQAAPNETMGILAGRCCEDQAGPYTVVEAVENAKSDEMQASPSFVQLSHTAHAQVRQRLVQTSWTCEPVGWFHSHPTFKAQFSGEDCQEQQTWTDNRHIGLVVSGIEAREPFAVYHGPQGHLLKRRTPWPMAAQRAQPQPKPQALHSLPMPADVHTFVIHPVWPKRSGCSWCGQISRDEWQRWLAASGMVLMPGLVVSLLVLVLMHVWMSAVK